MKKTSTPRVLILCGGKSLRLGDSSKIVPKPLVKIGHVPILLHLMKIYGYYGFKSFILCLGYKGEMIKQYFAHPPHLPSDFNPKQFQIEFVDTGMETETGGRIKWIEGLMEEDDFFLTYADGLANIDLQDLLKFHLRGEKIFTMTCVKARSQFGIAKLNSQGVVVDFKQKPYLTQWVNGGFFVCNRRVFDYLSLDDTLEEAPFQKLVAAKQLQAYKFKGFWACMDTYKDSMMLNEEWSKNRAKWKIW
ncbi:MAG: sugar phosphate nucleotidyltransferase [Candidatus Aminicenantaceae bacterium]